MSITSTKAKTGRKARPYVTSWGETIDGLTRCPDGRWRVIGSETAGRDVKFTEPDERLAVDRYRRLRNPAEAPTVQFGPITSPVTIDLRNQTRPGLQGSDPNVIVNESTVWGWVRQQILTRPAWVAEQTGIEQIGYLENLKPLPTSPTLREVGNLYHEKSGVSAGWVRLSKLYWAEFCDSVGGESKTLRSLTQADVADYKSEVVEAGQSPTYVKHRFGQIKTVIAYGKAWGKWSEDRARVLAYCSILIPPSSVSLDPKPISREHFAKLLATADAADNRLRIMRPVLLLALNAALYGAEVADVRWADLDFAAGTFVADRGKTSVARVAVLWPRTIEALKTLKRIDGIDSPFLTEATRQPHNGNTLNKYFRALRIAAGVPDDVWFAHVRDGAYTTACSTPGVQYETARILGGHRIGMSDHYVKRNPAIVADACSAIERHYFG